MDKIECEKKIEAVLRGIKEYGYACQDVAIAYDHDSRLLAVAMNLEHEAYRKCIRLLGDLASGFTNG